MFLIVMMKRLGVVAAQVIKKYTPEVEVLTRVVFYSMDDKPKVNVGEPHIAVALGERGRCGILPTDVKAFQNRVSYSKCDFACLRDA